jgi:transcriptional regulator with XRE-family HTH domain
MSETEERLALKERLQTARKAAGFETATSLAEFLGVSQQRYSNWDNGTYLPNDIIELRKLCDALDITCDYLLLGRSQGLSRTTYARIERLRAG